MLQMMFSGPLRRIDAMAPVLPSMAASVTADFSRGRSLRLMSWNLLAPPYIRGSRREDEAAWKARTKLQIDLVSREQPDIIGLQEFWVQSKPLVDMWSAFAREQGYVMHIVPRVDSKQDGIAMLVRLPAVSCTFSAYEFNDWGSRVLQVAELCPERGDPILLLQTHLTFPHQSAHDPIMRREQARKLSEMTRTIEYPTVLFGDLNGDETDEAVKVLTTFGGLRPMPLGRDGVSWVSHVAHTGAHMACDMALSRGECHVSDWSLGGSHDELVNHCYMSDHRPLLATIRFGHERCDVDDASATDEVP